MDPMRAESETQEATKHAKNTKAKQTTHATDTMVLRCDALTVPAKAFLVLFALLTCCESLFYLAFLFDDLSSAMPCEIPSATSLAQTHRGVAMGGADLSVHPDAKECGFGNSVDGSHLPTTGQGSLRDHCDALVRQALL